MEGIPTLRPETRAVCGPAGAEGSAVGPPRDGGGSDEGGGGERRRSAAAAASLLMVLPNYPLRRYSYYSPGVPLNPGRVMAFGGLYGRRC